MHIKVILLDTKHRDEMEKALNIASGGVWVLAAVAPAPDGKLWVFLNSKK